VPTSSIWARSAGRQDHRIVSERDDLPGTGKPRRKTPFGFWTYGSAGRSRDPSKGPRGTGDLGPCRPGPTPAESPLGSASMSVARRREPGGKPKGNRNPSNGRRRRTGERRTTGNQRKAGEGEEPGGQTGNRRKARRGTGGHDVRPQTTRSESGDLGPHASIMTAGMVLAGLREPRIVVHQLTATAVCLTVTRAWVSRDQSDWRAGDQSTVSRCWEYVSAGRDTHLVPGSVAHSPRWAGSESRTGVARR